MPDGLDSINEALIFVHSKVETECTSCPCGKILNKYGYKDFVDCCYGRSNSLSWPSGILPPNEPNYSDIFVYRDFYFSMEEIYEKQKPSESQLIGLRQAIEKCYDLLLTNHTWKFSSCVYDASGIKLPKMSYKYKKPKMIKVIEDRSSWRLVE
ncbi:MAG: hypothetical protein JXA66_06270 [Oligoflexia bacterium]|nr:hypothetical protein [Oligoflexia bacterium]